MMPTGISWPIADIFEAGLVITENQANPDVFNSLLDCELCWPSAWQVLKLKIKYNCLQYKYAKPTNLENKKCDYLYPLCTVFG
jgi:hypothetical protein